MEHWNAKLDVCVVADAVYGRLPAGLAERVFLSRTLAMGENDS